MANWKKIVLQGEADVITGGMIAAEAINESGQIRPGTITADLIGSNEVTLDKIADMATASLLGRSTAGTGDPEVLSASTARTLLGLNTTDDPTFDDVSVNRLGFSGQGAGLWSNSNGVGFGDIGLGQNNDLVSLDIGDQGGFEGKVHIHTDGNINFTFDQHNTSVVPLQVTSLGVGTQGSGTTGEIRATNEVTAYYSSDISLKENINPISNPLDKLLSIGGYNFDWKDKVIKGRGGEDGFFVRKKDVGILAQEIESVIPEIVVTRKDGTKAVKYEKLIPLLIESIKELTAKVTRLENGNS
jgi:hypothetical protein